MEKENCQGWRKRLLRCMDRIHKIYRKDFSCSGKRLTRNQKSLRPDDVWPDMWKFMSDAAKKKAKQKIGYRETKARQRQTTERNILFEPNDEEFKLTMKAARGKLEVPMPAALLCKIPIKSSGGTHTNIGNRKTKYVCVFDADESTRPRLEGAGHKPHQDHITAKATNSMIHYSLVHKFIPMPQAEKFQMRRQQWRKDGKNWIKSRHGS